MARDFGERVPVPGKTRSSADEAFLNFISIGGLIPLPGLNKENAAPKLFEVINFIPQSDGSVVFQPKPGVSKNVKARQLVRELNRKYSKPLGKLARSYAHTAQGNTNYNEALNAIFSGSAFGELQTVQPSETGFKAD
jgi:hypothetical protein